MSIEGTRIEYPVQANSGTFPDRRQLAPVRMKPGAGYLDGVRRFAMLERDQEYMLAKRWREHGDRNAANQLVNNIRTFPLRLNGVRQAPINIVNLSVMKDFRFRERIGLQFRAEAVDLLNHPIYAAPDMSPTSGTFGQVTTLGAGNTQRRISLGGRLSW